MNWNAVGAIGEVLGALAVLITLVYLALQVRQNTKAMKRTAFQELINYYGTITDFYSTREGAELVAKARHGLDLLDEPDRIRILNLVGKSFAHLQNVHQQWTEGLINESQWNQLSAVIVATLSSKSTRAIWDFTKDRYSLEFQSWVDSFEGDESYASKMEQSFYPQD